MVFDVAVQLFLNINRVIKFHVDMSKPDSQKFTS